MAILKAPLLSFGASGQIAKSMVFFSWKGLNVVRQHVVPSNPNTTAQQTQRGYLRAAVAKIHFCQGIAGILFGENDATSYATLGSLEATPRTWFNTIVKQWCDQKYASKVPAVYTKGSCVAGALKATLTLTENAESGGSTTGVIKYGTSKTNLINSHASSPAALEAGDEIAGLSAGVKYYFQYQSLTGATYVGTNSGIWHATPTAT